MNAPVPAIDAPETKPSYYRPMKYLSNSSFNLFEENRPKFYRQYLKPDKPPRDPQNHHMAVGSAFDAYAKSHLHKLIVDDNDPRFEFTTIFEAQVEPQCRDKALVDGKTVFDAYIKSGALGDLILKLNGCAAKPQFEMTVEGIVNGQRPGVCLQLGAVPLLGKPDLYFRTNAGIRISADWKVNGFYSKSGVSPTKGFVRLYPTLERHEDCYPVLLGDVTINGMLKMEQVDASWAAQLAMYAWLLGEKVGSDFVVMIHQLVCRPTGIRVAELMMQIGEDFQWDLYKRLHDVWYRIQAGEIFDDMTAEESLVYAKSIDEAPPRPEWMEQTSDRVYFKKKVMA